MYKNFLGNTNFNIMTIEKIKAILRNKYELTEEELAFEREIWHIRIVNCWGIDTESEPTEEESEAKRKQAEYMHNYYVTHRKKKETRALNSSKNAIRSRATMSKLRSRKCLYEGKQVSYGTLMARLHNKMGYSWPDSRKIALESLVDDENN